MDRPQPAAGEVLEGGLGGREPRCGIQEWGALPRGPDVLGRQECRDVEGARKRKLDRGDLGAEQLRRARVRISRYRAVESAVTPTPVPVEQEKEEGDGLRVQLLAAGDNGSVGASRTLAESWISDLLLTSSVFHPISKRGPTRELSCGFFHIHITI